MIEVTQTQIKKALIGLCKASTSGNLKLVLNGDHLYISALQRENDFQLELTRTIHGQREATFQAFEVDAKRFKKLVDKMGKGFLFLSYDGDLLTLSRDKFKVSMPAFRLSGPEIEPTFPSLLGESPIFGYENDLRGSLEGLSALLETAAKPNDESRSVMTGIGFQLCNLGKLWAVATDGRRAHRVDLSSSIYDQKIMDLHRRWEGFTIPAEAFKAFPKSEKLSLRVESDGSLLYNLRSETCEVSGTMIEGRMPQMHKVFPSCSDYTKKIHVNREDLLASVKRLLPICENNKRAPNLFTLDVNGKIELSVSSDDGLSASDEVEAAHSIGEDIRIGLSGLYLRSFLQAAETEKVQLNFREPTKSVLVNAEEKSQHVIMPVKL